MTLRKDDHVQKQFCAKLSLCKNSSLHKWLYLHALLCKEDFSKRWIGPYAGKIMFGGPYGPMQSSSCPNWLLSKVVPKQSGSSTNQFLCKVVPVKSLSIETSVHPDMFKRYPLWRGLWVEKILSRVKSVLRGPYRNRTLCRQKYVRTMLWAYAKQFLCKLASEQGSSWAKWYLDKLVPVQCSSCAKWFLSRVVPVQNRFCAKKF